MARPDYIIIGAQRCGTTSMMRYLGQHRGVDFVARKEVQYFSWNFHRSLDWYGKQIGKRRRGYLYGEKSPCYLPDPKVPERVKRFVPNAKFIVLLRNPVDRAWSHYWFAVGLKRERLAFKDAMRQPPGWVAKYWGVDVNHYLYRGQYAEQLRRWFGQFPREQFIIVCTEDFLLDPGKEYRRVCDFLGLPPDGRTEFPRHGARSKGKMHASTRRWLTNYFEPHNQELYELLGQNFGWED